MFLSFLVSLVVQMFLPGIEVIEASDITQEVWVGSIVPTQPVVERRNDEWEMRREKPLIALAPRPNEAPQHRGVFLTAWSMTNAKRVDGTIDALKRLDGNAIVLDVKGNQVYFDVRSPLVEELGLEHDIYDLHAAVKKLHEHGIYVIARFDTISDRGLTAVRPDTQLKHPVTGRYLAEGWIDPINPLALDYNSHVLCEVAASGIDEINLDYIRYDTAKSYELSVYSGTQKADRIEAFIKMARETVDRCGPGTKLGLSTFAILAWDYAINVASLGQDVVRFAPYVDIISPMAYPISFSDTYYDPAKHQGPRTRYLIWRTMDGYQKLLGPEHSMKLRPWIQGFSLGSNEIANQIRGVYDAGLCGFTVWNAHNEYAPSYSAMERMEVPARCRPTAVL